MKLKIPPALVLLSFGSLMYLVAEFLPVGYFDFFGRRYLIMGLLASAIIIGMVAIFQFSTAKTSIDPMNLSKSSQLVTKGVYSFTRNPIYLALLLILLAWGLWLANAFNTLLAAGFVSYMNAFQILPEEKALFQIFGKDYQQYCKKVRRWF